MQSSTARNLSKLNSNLAVDESENEPLLEGCAGDANADAHDFSVLVDKGEDAPQPKRSARKSEALINMKKELDVLQHGADANVRRAKAKTRLYSAAGFTLLTSAVTAPVVGLYYFWECVKVGVLNDFEINKVSDALSVDSAHFQEDRDKYNQVSTELEAKRTERDKFLMPHYERWWHYDSSNTNCWKVNDPDPELGNAVIQQIRNGEQHPQNHFFSKLDEDNNIPGCLAVKHDGQLVEGKHFDLLRDIDTDERILGSLGDKIHDDYRRMQAGQELLQRYNTNAIVFASASTLLLAMLASCVLAVPVGFAIKYIRSRWEDFDAEKLHLESIGGNVSDGLLNDLEKLPVSLQLQANVALADLTQELAKHVDEIEVPARKRAAFLSGKNYPNSGLFGFLNTPGSKETTKMIFGYAGLLPRP